MPTPETVTVRKARHDDLEDLLRINNAAVPAVNHLALEDLQTLLGKAHICLVAELDGKPGGFLLCLSERLQYGSKNYAWLSARYDSFAYTDRIAVDEALRGQRAGEALYQTLFSRLAGEGRPFVCEVNERPPNPGSFRFHKRLGFEEIGRADHGSTAVVYMKRTPEPAK